MGDNIVDKNIVDKKYETIVHMVITFHFQR